MGVVGWVFVEVSEGVDTKGEGIAWNFFFFGKNGCVSFSLSFSFSSWEKSQEQKQSLTNPLHPDLNPRAQDFVPPINTPDQPTRALEAACAAQRMRKGCIGREVSLERLALDRWRRLGERVDYGGDFGCYEELVNGVESRD